MTRKQVVQAEMAIQKFCAIGGREVCADRAIQPPLPSAVGESVGKGGGKRAGRAGRVKAPWPVVRFQNMPSRNVANSGAFTKLKTSCRKSLMELNDCARYAQADREGHADDGGNPADHQVSKTMS